MNSLGGDMMMIRIRSVGAEKQRQQRMPHMSLTGVQILKVG